MGAIFEKLKGMETVSQKMFSDALNEATISHRLLTDFTLEISPVCNFKCKMCYARYSPEEIAAMGRRVLTFDDWKYYIDGFAAIGALTCTLTGGECTIHPDFCKIYSYAYSMGLQITIMTNGSNITDEILDMFKRMPPNKLMITVYGASEQKYDEMCSNASAYNKVMRNIDRLLDARITVIPQFTASKDNISDMEAVYNFAASKGLEFRYTSLLTSFDKCTDEVLAENTADTDEYVRQHRKIWCAINNKPDEYIEEQGDSVLKRLASSIEYTKVVKKGMQCNAGRNSCHVNWKGEITPCVMIDSIALDPHKSNVKDCWEQIIAWADEVPQLVDCQTCIHRIRCKSCIALHYNDTGVFGKPSPRICWKQLHPEEAAKIEAKYLKHE